MIEVYVSNNTNYQKNGDITLTPLSCYFEMTLDGISQIELTHEYDDLGRWEYLVNDNVIAAPTPYSEKQLFRIYNRIKDDNEVTVYARHIYFDNLTNVLIDVRPTSKTGQEALDIIFSGTKFKGYSDITSISTAYYVRKNIVSAIAGDDDNSFINRWGGERLYDNYNVHVMRQLGSDKGVRAEFGYNLTGIEESISTEETLTRIIPVAFNGHTLEGATPWIDSPNIEEYAEIKAGVVKFEEIKLQEDCNEDETGYANLTELRKALVSACNAEYEKGIDTPTVNYTVNMVDLSQTEEYKNYKQLVNAEIGDTITCSHKRIKVEAKARCIRIKWNCLTKENEEVELGNFLQNYFDKTSNSLQQATASVEGTNSQALAAKEVAQEAAKESNEAAETAKTYATEAQAAKTAAETQAAAAKAAAETAASQIPLATAAVKAAEAQVAAAETAARNSQAAAVTSGEHATQAAAQAKTAQAAAEVATSQATAAGQHEAAAIVQAKAAAEAQTAAETAQGKAETAATTATSKATAAETARAAAVTAQGKAEAAANTVAESVDKTERYYELTKELYENASLQAGQSSEAWLDLSYMNNCYLSE